MRRLGVSTAVLKRQEVFFQEWLQLPLRQLLLVLLLLIAGHPSSALTESESADAPAAISLTPENWDAAFASCNSSFAIVEFFASWCPVCIRFKPQYEVVAKRFNLGPQTNPSIKIFSVDCMSQGELCHQYNIARYPTMYWGKPSTFLSEARARNEFEVLYIEERTADALLKWINDKLSTQFTLSTPTAAASLPPASSNATAVLPSTRADKKVDLVDIELATILSIQYPFAGQFPQSASRSSLVKYLHLLAYHHPVGRCRVGSKLLLDTLPSVWPRGRRTGPRAQSMLQSWRVCGDRETSGNWSSCQGSVPNSRGFSCGLWLLFHSLAAQLEDGADGTGFLDAVKAYVQDFFVCEDCSRHFVQMASEPDALTVKTKANAVLWLWRAHNQVNERLAKDDMSMGAPDPEFPKLQWPTADLCPQCHTGSEWNEVATYNFLVDYYGASEPQAAVFYPRGGLSYLSTTDGVPPMTALLLVAGIVVTVVVLATIQLRGTPSKLSSRARRLF